MEKPSASLDELLAPFKSSESPETCVCILDDPEAKKILAIWSTLPVEFRPARNPPADPRLAWDWLWSGVSVNIPDLAARANVSAIVAEKKLRMLQAARLVYPDGTISSYASGVLRADVVRRIPKAQKR